MKENLKKFRKTLGLKQREVAQKLKVDVGLIGKWEAGIQSIPETRIYQLCKEFNIRESWLRTGEGEMFESPSVITDEEKKAAQLEFVVEIFKSLSPKQRDIILKALEDYVLKQKASASLKTQTNNGTVNGDMIQN